jgi:hypothetical protein
MKEICKCADAFVQKCSIKDFALLKICLCAVGIMVGLSIPEKNGLFWPQVLFSFSVIY